MLAARVAVFVVEQNCAYQDLDGLDAEAEHLIAWSGAEVADFGFATVSEPYLEDDIPHVEMVLS